MPFTFSHPAIVLPLTFLPKRWLSLTGLVIGSLTPDFEYFLRMKVLSNFSHTLAGLFWFDLPFGILLTFVFHLLVRNPLFDNLPNFLNCRLYKFKSFDWLQYFKSNWLVVLISVLLGASSHILWDGFTHDHGYFVARYPVLLTKTNLLGFTVSIHKIIQHVSTLMGAAVLFFSVMSFQKTPHKSQNISSKYWILFVALSLIITTIRTVYGLNFNQYGDILVTGMSAGMISFLATPILLKIFQKDIAS